MQVKVSDVQAIALRRGDEYFEDVMRAGTLSSDGRLIDLPLDEFNAIRSKWSPGAPLARAVRYGKALVASAVADPPSDEVVALREKSCRSCRHFLDSKVAPGKHFCGLCGCGDKRRAILEGKKWLMPSVDCDLKMPGWSNAEEAIE